MDFISYSQISSFLRCPRQYEYQYIEKIHPPTPAVAFVSKVWHNVLQQNYSQKIETNTDLPMEEMISRFVAAFDMMMRKEEIDWGEEWPVTLKERGVSIVEAHHNEIAPYVRPVRVEQEFKVWLGKDFPQLRGTWDLIDDEGYIIDNKSYFKEPEQEDIDKNLQLTIYALAYRLDTQKIERGLGIDCVIRTRKAMRFKTNRTDQDCQWLLKLLSEVVTAIQTGIFYPQPEGWHCHPKRCFFWKQCRERR